MRFTLPNNIRRGPRPGARPGSRPGIRSRTPRLPAGGEAPGGPVAPSAEYVGRRQRRGSSQRTPGGGAIFPRRRRASTLSRRATLVALLGASLGLLTVSYQGGAAIHGAQMVALDVVAPIERGLVRAWEPVQGAFDWTAALVSGASENDDLRRENDELRARLSIATVQEDDLHDIRRQLAYKERGIFPEGYEQRFGTVITRSPTAIDHSITIDLGTEDGVHLNDPVMVVGALIGRVVKVSRNAAVVGLVINSEQRVTATVVGSNATGVLSSVSNDANPVMRLAYVSQTANVHENDLVVTAGFGRPGDDLNSLYPRGIPIGVVSSVGNNPGDLDKTIQVTPYANFDRIDRVIVLVARGGREPLVEPDAQQAGGAVSATTATGVQPGAPAASTQSPRIAGAARTRTASGRKAAG